MSKGSIIKSLKALRRRKGLKDDSHLGSSFSLVTSQASLSSMLNKSESHLDQSPIWVQIIKSYPRKQTSYILHRIATKLILLRLATWILGSIKNQFFSRTIYRRVFLNGFSSFLRSFSALLIGLTSIWYTFLTEAFYSKLTQFPSTLSLDTFSPTLSFLVCTHPPQHAYFCYIRVFLLALHYSTCACITDFTNNRIYSI